MGQNNTWNPAQLNQRINELEASGTGSNLPEVTSADNGKVLQVVNGAWATGDEIPVNANDYSGTEKVIGKWVDGKPIYEKTITIENFDLDGTSTFFPNVHFGQIIIADYFSDVDKMWCDYNGTILYLSTIGKYRNVMFVDSQDPKLTIFSIPEYTGTTLTLTMRYTKTTD